MKRRIFLTLLAFSTMNLNAINFHETKPDAWNKSNLNDAALALYGKEKFSTIQESNRIELVVPSAAVENRFQVPIKVKSDINAKSIAFFQTANEQSLVAVMSLNEHTILDYEFNIVMEKKGTFFAVVEGVDGKLYYARAYIDVIRMSCMAG